MRCEVFVAKAKGSYRLEYHKLIFAGVLLTLATILSVSGEPPGFLEGHLKVISPSEVQLADETSPTTSAENYAEYSLIILSQGAKKKSRV